MRLSRSGLFALLVVYLVWGSTFLAIRVAVTGDGFSPYQLAAIRTLAAGVCLLLLGVLRGESCRVSFSEFGSLLLTGLLLWVGGHTLLLWAAPRVDSGLSALLFASIPFWSVLLTARSREWRAKELAPVGLGFLGVALVFPVSGSAFGVGSLLDGAVVLLSAFFWSLGSVLPVEKRIPVAVASGYQLLFAGAANAAIALFAGGLWPAHADSRSLLACIYLVLPGCVLAFLAYAHTLRTLPLSLSMSFAYVNPLVAVALGVLVLGEQVSFRAAAGMLVVLGSVFWLVSAREGQAV